MHLLVNMFKEKIKFRRNLLRLRRSCSDIQAPHSIEYDDSSVAETCTNTAVDAKCTVHRDSELNNIRHWNAVSPEVIPGSNDLVRDANLDTCETNRDNEKEHAKQQERKPGEKTTNRESYAGKRSTITANTDMPAATAFTILADLYTNPHLASSIHTPRARTR